MEDLLSNKRQEELRTYLRSGKNGKWTESHIEWAITFVNKVRTKKEILQEKSDYANGRLTNMQMLYACQLEEFLYL